MNYTIDLIDKLYQLFKTDETILKVLNIKDNKNVQDVNAKIRRQFETQELLDSTKNTFFVYTFIPAVGTTKNYQVNSGMIEFRLYSPLRGDLNTLYKAITSLLHSKFEDMWITSEGSISTGTKNLTGYMFRVRPLVWS